MSPSPNNNLPSKPTQEIPERFRSLIDNIQRWAGNLASIGFCLKSEARLDASIGRRITPEEDPVVHTLEITAAITQQRRIRLWPIFGRSNDNTQIVLESPTLGENLASYGDARVACYGPKGRGNATSFSVRDRPGRPQKLDVTFAFFRGAVLGAYAGVNGISKLPSQVGRLGGLTQAPATDLSAKLSIGELADLAFGLISPSFRSSYSPEDLTKNALTLRLSAPQQIRRSANTVFTEGPDGHIKVIAWRVENPKITTVIDLNYRTGEIAIGDAEERGEMRVVERAISLADARVWINGFLAGFAAGSAGK